MRIVWLVLLIGCGRATIIEGDAGAGIAASLALRMSPAKVLIHARLDRVRGYGGGQKLFDVPVQSLSLPVMALNRMFYVKSVGVESAIHAIDESGNDTILPQKSGVTFSLTAFDDTFYWTETASVLGSRPVYYSQEIGGTTQPVAITSEVINDRVVAADAQALYYQAAYVLMRMDLSTGLSTAVADLTQVGDDLQPAVLWESETTALVLSRFGTKTRLSRVRSGAMPVTIVEDDSWDARSLSQCSRISSGRLYYANGKAAFSVDLTTFVRTELKLARAGVDCVEVVDQTIYYVATGLIYSEPLQ